MDCGRIMGCGHGMGRGDFMPCGRHLGYGDLKGLRLIHVRRPALVCVTGRARDGTKAGERRPCPARSVRAASRPPALQTARAPPRCALAQRSIEALCQGSPPRGRAHGPGGWSRAPPQAVCRGEAPPRGPHRRWTASWALTASRRCSPPSSKRSSALPAPTLGAPSCASTSSTSERPCCAESSGRDLALAVRRSLLGSGGGLFQGRASLERARLRRRRFRGLARLLSRASGRLRLIFWGGR